MASIFTLDIDPEQWGGEIPDDTEPYAFIAGALNKVAADLIRNRNDAATEYVLDATGGKIGEWTYEPPRHEYLVMVEMVIEAGSETEASDMAESAVGGSDVTDYSVVSVETN
jgi:hypothetical protein